MYTLLFTGVACHRGHLLNQCKLTEKKKKLNNNKQYNT